MFLIVGQHGAPEQARTPRSTRSGASSSSPGPGLFLPLEQEVGRALAHRRAQGIGGGPLVHRAARLGAHPHRGDGRARRSRSAPLYVDGRSTATGCSSGSLAIGLVGFYCMHTDARHALGQRAVPAVRRDARDRRRRPKLVGALVALALGVENAGAYGDVHGALAVRRGRGIALRGQKRPARARPAGAVLGAVERRSAGCSPARVLMQLLGYSSLLGVNVLEGPAPTRRRSRAFTTRVLRRPDPATAVPGGPGHPAPEAGRPRRRGPPRRLPHRVQAAAWCIVVRHRRASAPSPRSRSACRSARSCSRRSTSDALDLGLLAAGSGMFIIALTIAQALIALKGHKRGRGRLGLGVLVFVRRSRPSISELELRVELGFLAGTVATTARHGLGAARAACAAASTRASARSSPRSSTNRSSSDALRQRRKRVAATPPSSPGTGLSSTSAPPT